VILGEIGIAPTSAPDRRSSTICGSQPLLALAQPVSISAERNSWRRNAAHRPARSIGGSIAGERIDDADAFQVATIQCSSLVGDRR